MYLRCYMITKSFTLSPRNLFHLFYKRCEHHLGCRHAFFKYWLYNYYYWLYVRKAYIILIRKFHKCSTEVKIRLFRAYCICLYGAALWTRFAAESLNKFRRCYHKSIKMFLGTASITVSLLFWLIWGSPVLTLLSIPIQSNLFKSGNYA